MLLIYDKACLRNIIVDLHQYAARESARKASTKMQPVSQAEFFAAASGTGEGEFLFTIVVIGLIFVIVYVRAREKQSKEAEQFRQVLAEAETRRTHQHLSESAEPGNAINPEVVALLKSVPASTKNRDAFDHNAVLQAALEVHDALGTWMPMLRVRLAKAGTSGDEATFQMGVLYSSIEQASQTYFPPIVSLAVTSTLRSYVEFLSTEEGDLNGITAPLAVKIICPLSTLEEGLFVLLQEAGWSKERISEQCRELSSKISKLASAAKGGIAPLTFAFTVDAYARALVSGAMGQPKSQ